MTSTQFIYGVQDEVRRLLPNRDDDLRMTLRSLHNRLLTQVSEWQDAGVPEQHWVYQVGKVDGVVYVQLPPREQLYRTSAAKKIAGMSQLQTIEVVEAEQYCRFVRERPLDGGTFAKVDKEAGE